MENQIDRRRIMADENLRREFKSWLLDPVNFAELDRGTILIPDKFLANGAVVPTPVGFVPSNLLPEFGLVQGEDANPVFAEADVVAALRKAASAARRYRTSSRSAASSAGSTTSPARAATRPAASAASIFRASTGWRPNPPTRPWCRPRRISSATRSAVAIFLPRCGTAGRRTIPRDLPAARNCAAATNSPAPSIATVGARIVIGSRRNLPKTSGVFANWTCAKGLACQVAGEATRMGMCFVKSP